MYKPFAAQVIVSPLNSLNGQLNQWRDVNQYTANE